MLVLQGRILPLEATLLAEKRPGQVTCTHPPTTDLSAEQRSGWLEDKPSSCDRFNLETVSPPDPSSGLGGPHQSQDVLDFAGGSVTWVS